MKDAALKLTVAKNKKGCGQFHLGAPGKGLQRGETAKLDRNEVSVTGGPGVRDSQPNKRQFLRVEKSR